MSNLNQFLSEEFLRNARRFGTANMGVAASLVLLREFEAPFLPNEVGIIAFVWLILNAMASPFVARLSATNRSSVKDPTCNYCGSDMFVTGLKCSKCDSTSTQPSSVDRLAGK